MLWYLYIMVTVLGCDGFGSVVDEYQRNSNAVNYWKNVNLLLINNLCHEYVDAVPLG